MNDRIKREFINLLIFLAIVAGMSFVLGLIGALIHGVEWLDSPLDNFDFVLLLAFIIAFQAIHHYEDH